MKLPKPVEDIVLQTLEGKFGSTKLGRFQVATGGCINNGGKLETSAGAFFIKWNDAQKLPSLFETEARGLSLLRKANAFYVPGVTGVVSMGGYQVIVLEFVEGTRNNR
jgi:fructosamine-3-kinase